jgi:hypothetical protein
MPISESAQALRKSVHHPWNAGSNVLQDWFPYPRATNTHNSVPHRIGSGTQRSLSPRSCEVICPFHDDSTPSCQLFADHFHCYGCGAHGSRIDWLVEAEGMTRAEAVKLILDWDGERRAPVETRRRPIASAHWRCGMAASRSPARRPNAT